jgi:hypothetical protein
MLLFRSARRLIGRAVVSFVALAVLAAVVPAAASAAITATSISSPANQSTFFVDQSQSSSTATAFTVTGTANAAGNVDIDCTTASGETAHLVTTQPVTADSFSLPVTDAELYTAANATDDGPCVLRVEPAGATPAAPGAASTYGGPLISISYEQIYTHSGVPNDFYAQYTGAATGSAGTLEFTSPGDCGLEDSFITSGGSSLVNSADGLDCVGSLFSAYTSGEDSAVEIPSELTVDGASGAVADGFGNATTIPGYEQPTVTDGYAGGELTIDDDEPVMLCLNACGYGTAPTGFKPSGIELDRTWQTTDNGLVVLQKDVFKSTDGAAHTLTVREDDDIADDPSLGASVDFPGTSGFLQYQPGNTVAPVSGPGAIYFKTNPTTPDSGDPASRWLQGAIAYSRAPDGPIAVTYWTSAGEWSPEFYLPYNLSVPAGGSAVLRFAYAQDFALSDVKTLAQQALSGFDPVLSLTSPTNNSTSSSPQVTVTGTVTDAAGIKSLTLNGTNATVTTAGAFSASFDLPVGANTITAVATDADGLTTTQTAAVTVAMQTTTSLGTKIKTGKHHRYKLTGKLALPAGVSATQGCTGTITITARKGRRKVASATAKLGSGCGWSAKFTAKHLKHHGKLKVTVTFTGNTAIKPFTPKVLKAKY